LSKPKLAQFVSKETGDGRRYKSPIDGSFVPSVTTITGKEDKSAMIQWAVRLTLAWADENWMRLGNQSSEDTLRRGAYRWRDVRDERAQIGTEVHEWAESDLNGAWDTPEVWGEVAECVEQWLDLRQHHDIQPVHVEATVWSDEHGYAGTLDGLGYIDGVLTLWDVKTSKGLFHSHEMQLAALARADFMWVEVAEGTEGCYRFDGKDDDGNPETTFWVKKDIPKVEKYAFIHLRPNYFDPLKKEWVPAFWKIEYVDPEDIDGLFETFLGYRQVVRGLDKTKQVRKNRENKGENK
jgi:hypothetical protein